MRSEGKKWALFKVFSQKGSPKRGPKVPVREGEKEPGHERSECLPCTGGADGTILPFGVRKEGRGTSEPIIS